MFLLSGLQIAKEDQEILRDLLIQRAQNIKPRSIISEKDRKSTSQAVQVKDSDYSKCMQEDSRTCETMVDLGKIPQHDAAAEAGAIGEPMECC